MTKNKICKWRITNRNFEKVVEGMKVWRKGELGYSTITFERKGKAKGGIGFLEVEDGFVFGELGDERDFGREFLFLEEWKEKEKRNLSDVFEERSPNFQERNLLLKFWK